MFALGHWFKPVGFRGANEQNIEMIQRAFLPSGGLSDPDTGLAGLDSALCHFLEVTVYLLQVPWQVVVKEVKGAVCSFINTQVTQATAMARAWTDHGVQSHVRCFQLKAAIPVTPIFLVLTPKTSLWKPKKFLSCWVGKTKWSAMFISVLLLLLYLICSLSSNVVSLCFILFLEPHMACSRIIPASLLRNHLWWSSKYHIWCKRSNPGHLHAWQASYQLCYVSFCSPKLVFVMARVGPMHDILFLKCDIASLKLLLFVGMGWGEGEG